MERVVLMYVWEQSEIVKTHRLTVAMVWALLGVGKVRPSTWAALVRRDLAEHASDGGHRLTATGQGVADELHNLTSEPETAPEDKPTRQVTVTGSLDGHQADNPVHRVTVHPGTVLSVRDGDHGPEFLANGLWWVTTPEALAAQTAVQDTPEGGPVVLPSVTVEMPNGDPVMIEGGPLYPECEDVETEPEAATRRAAAEVVDIPSTPVPSLTRADEVHAGDYVLHAGTRRQVIGTRIEGRDIVLSTVHGTLTMPPSTPLRVEPAQLSLSLAG